jgi:hypothetical protein
MAGVCREREVKIGMRFKSWLTVWFIRRELPPDYFLPNFGTLKRLDFPKRSRLDGQKIIGRNISAVVRYDKEAA